MRARDLLALGIPRQALPLATGAAKAASLLGAKKGSLRRVFQDLVAAPQDFLEDASFADLAQALIRAKRARLNFVERSQPAPFNQWGQALDPASIRQMENASRLPVSVAGALMPDAHVGYGLPIGGVLAARNAVIPYAVGVDIACRMKLTVLDLPTTALTGQRDRLAKTLEGETRFGIGATFRQRREHPVLDEDWSISPTTKALKDKAWAQLGTSGSGNHFVEFGHLTLLGPSSTEELELERGTYLALLSHSGSRGTGATLANHFSRLAMDLHPGLPRDLKQLAWLDLETEPGQEYWKVMELMGRYAEANHSCIHRHIAKALGAKVLLDIENHHNFAWKEEHGGEELIVHRKGSTPAGRGVLGVIPGSMATPGYVVRGLGEARSLNSAAHGAGRRMSRRQANQSFTWSEAKKLLSQRDVTVLSAGLDEVPMAYKDIEEVMAAQQDLVEVLARFDPKLVKMAPAGERAED